ncbi:Fc.00g013160.m01.CDS01 [Cosmosporella sp. VM-42]
MRNPISPIRKYRVGTREDKLKISTYLGKLALLELSNTEPLTGWELDASLPGDFPAQATRQQIRLFPGWLSSTKLNLTKLTSNSSTASRDRQPTSLRTTLDQLLPGKESPLTGPGYDHRHRIPYHVDATGSPISLPPLIEAGSGLGRASTSVAWPGSLYSLTIRGQPQCDGPETTEGGINSLSGRNTTADCDTQALLTETEKLLDSWKHPDPYVPPCAPGGSKFERNLPSPILDPPPHPANRH